MSTENGMRMGDQKRELLERRADVVRARFLRTVDALDARRHQVAEAAEAARSLATPAALSVIGVVAIVGVGLFTARAMSHRRSFASRVSRTLASMGFARPPSFGRRVLETAAFAGLSAVARELFAGTRETPVRT